ncbi:hypothetical protein ACFLZX_06255 [Nanoarchaeota archaeon]
MSNLEQIKGGRTERARSLHESLSSLDSLFSQLKSQYNIPEEHLIELLKSSKKSETLFIPLSILSMRPLGILESITKYLHENINLTFSQIATLLYRDPRTIWASYNKSKKKFKDKFVADYSSIHIPIYVFQNRKFGTLESVVRYLKFDHNMKLHEIAIALNRDDRTIWTCLSRSNKK